MTKIRHFIKPYFFSLVAVVILLFSQAYADLTLPDQMQYMVNIGIQNHGIEQNYFDAFPAKMMDSLLFVAPNDVREKIQAHYRLVQPEQASRKEKKTYPLLKKEAIYIAKGEPSSVSHDLLKLMAVGSVLSKSKTPVQPQMIEQINQEVDKKLSGLGKSSEQSFLANTIDQIHKQLKMDRQSTQNNYVLKIGMTMLGFSLLSGLCAIGVGFLASRFSAGLARDLRKAIFNQITFFTQTSIDRFSVSTLITRTTNDIQQIQFAFVMSLQMILYAPILGVGALLHLLQSSTGIEWILAISIGAVLALVLVVFSLVLPKFRLMQTLTDRLNSVVSELLSGVLVIRAFNNQNLEQAKFKQANDQITQTSLFTSRVMAMSMPVMMLIMNLTMLGILWFGGHQLANGSSQIGSIMAFIQYAIQVIMSFVMMTMVFIFVPRASVAAQRVREVLNTDHPLQLEGQAQTPSEYSVSFDHVSFSYPNAHESVLSDLSFVAQPGEMTGIIGSTGSGKSTISKLLMHFYDVNEGQIRLGQLPLTQIESETLRANIGYVAQKAQLMVGSVRSNLLYANEKASEQDMWAALKMAQADFVNDLDMDIASGGTNLSGGQRQRLSIARALVAKPKILIFDDSFSALDYQTDARLRQALMPWIRENQMTVLVIAQRIASIRHADQIIVLDEGKMVGKGRHEQLMQTCEVYQEIASSQQQGQEGYDD